MRAASNSDTEVDRSWTTDDLELAILYAYHPPKDDFTRELHETVRARCYGLAAWLDINLPEGEEKVESLRRVREAMMWANAGIACRGA